MIKLDNETFEYFESYLTNPPKTDDEIEDYTANAINLAPVMIREIWRLRSALDECRQWAHYPKQIMEIVKIALEGGDK